MNAYEFEMLSLTGEPGFLEQFAGKVTLMVNIATRIGYTPKCSPFWSYVRGVRQMWELQVIHDRYKDKGFSVVAFPCNQFGGMEPLDDTRIAREISHMYPFVTFPISQKLEVNGKGEHPLYSFLKGNIRRLQSAPVADGSESAAIGQNLEGEAMYRIPHNGEKFLVGRSGNMIIRFNWQAMPLDTVPLNTCYNWTICEAIEEVI